MRQAAPSWCSLLPQMRHRGSACGRRQRVRVSAAQPIVMIRPAFVLLGLVAPLLGGCALGSASSTHGGSTTAPRTTKQPDALELLRLSTYQGHGITFTYPASWQHRHRGFYTTMTAPIVDLGT